MTFSISINKMNTNKNDNFVFLQIFFNCTVPDSAFVIEDLFM